MDAEDLLFILFTSGSTGKPKGVAHTTAGYLLYAAMTCQTTFDLQEGDIYGEYAREGVRVRVSVSVRVRLLGRGAVRCGVALTSLNLPYSLFPPHPPLPSPLPPSSVRG